VRPGTWSSRIGAWIARHRTTCCTQDRRSGRA
jgi:hypothetical protein